MRLAGGMRSSCSRNGSMLVSKKRSMGLGPLGIAAEAGFGNEGRNAAELRAGRRPKGEQWDMLMEAVFAAQTLGRRVRRRSPGEPAAREAVTHRRGADREATEPENASNRIHSGLLGSRPTLFRGPKIRARQPQIHESTAEISPDVVVRSGFPQRCCMSVTVAATMNPCKQ